MGIHASTDQDDMQVLPPHGGGGYVYRVRRNGQVFGQKINHRQVCAATIQEYEFASFNQGCARLSQNRLSFPALFDARRNRGCTRRERQRPSVNTPAFAFRRECAQIAPDGIFRNREFCCENAGHYRMPVGKSPSNEVASRKREGGSHKTMKTGINVHFYAKTELSVSTRQSFFIFWGPPLFQHKPQMNTKKSSY